MRIALVNWTNRRAGGIETYLDTVICGLSEQGNDVALWHEVSRPPERERIFVPDGSPAWCVEDLGVNVALRHLRDWQPQLIYAHGLLDLDLEAQLTSIAPAVFFAHQYYGTCVGGSKTWKFPRVVPCTRKFGWQCLLHYYPHYCGGWHPQTMVREYRKQSQRIKTLGDYRGIVTHTEHMRQEYLKHGFPQDRVHKIPFPIAAATSPIPPRKPSVTKKRSPFNLLFLGRMDRLKGGDFLIHAAAAAATELAHPLQLTFAGDGPKRLEWEKKALRLQTLHGDLTTSFVGWVSAPNRDRLFAEADLLVVPSLWPEPFGMVGIEAGMFGVPSAAFAVGGIPEWLNDGKNGHLAPGNPPTVQELGQTIVRCLEDSVHYEDLCDGALAVSRTYTTSAHLDALLEVFSLAADQGPLT